jgi:glycosyltransferase involved in cell wall biosynthesis
MKNISPLICLVTDTYWPAKGGVEAWVHAYSAHLEKKFRISIIAHAKEASSGTILSRTVFLRPFVPFKDDFGNQVSCLSPSIAGRIAMAAFILWHFPLVRRLWPRPVFDFLYIFYRRAFFKRLSKAVANADIVHCFSTSHLAVCATDACRKRGIGLIHSPPVHFDKWGDTPLLLSSYARADAIICLSHMFKKEFERRMPAQSPAMFVVPALTIDNSTGSRPAAAPQKPFVLFLGRREMHKGIGLLLSAFEKMSGKAVLAVAGPGDAHAALPPPCIDYGEVNEAEKQWLLKNCDILCVPSADESFGIVYIEAMRYARPVVALDVAPVNEIVLNGKTGILVPPGDRDASARTLARALEQLLGDASLGETMGRNGLRRYEEKYQPTVILDQLMKIYERLLRERSIP